MHCFPLLTAAALLLAGPAFAAGPQPLLIRDVRLFDGHITASTAPCWSAMASSPPSAGLVWPARTRSSSPAPERRCSRDFDAHVHVSHGLPEKVLQRSARLGVTTVLDTVHQCRDAETHAGARRPK